MSTHQSIRRFRPLRGRRFSRPRLENLEARLVMTVSPQLNLIEFHAASRIPQGMSPSAIGILPEVNGVSSPVGYSPADLETAYGIDNIHFGSIVGDGTGQTIAIVDAYDDPNFVDSSDSADFPAATSPSLIRRWEFPIRRASQR